MQLVEVGLWKPVVSQRHHVRYVLIEFKDVDVFSGTVGRLFEWILRRCSFPEMSFCFIGLWISVEAKG